jgi:DNA topoisomerase IB
LELEKLIDKVREHIKRGLESHDLLERKIATVCYLIDELKLRVGDEKDEDEADTVGATTLRPEHLKFNPDGTITFDFLGKDSVRWVSTINPPEVVYRNLKEFIAEGNETIFNGVRSQKVNAYLAEVMPGLTAKVFRLTTPPRQQRRRSRMPMWTEMIPYTSRSTAPQWQIWRPQRFATTRGNCQRTRRRTSERRLRGLRP